MLKLSDRQWKPFRVGDYFNTEERGRRLTNPNRKEGKTPFVTAGEVNNGVSAFIDNDTHKQYRDAITLDMFANAFYQHWTFKCDDNITILKLHSQSPYVHLFIATVLKQLQEKYSYATQVRPQRLAHEKIMLPINAEGTPDWDFMHDYMYERERPKIRLLIKQFTKRYNRNANYLVGHPLTTNFEDLKWGVFTVGGFFDVILAKGDLKPKELQVGKCPLISAGKTDNGVEMMFNNKDIESDWLPKNSITFDMFGNCFAQPFPFYAVGHGRVNICVPKSPLPFHTLSFITTCMNKEQYQFSYNHAAYTYVVARLKIHLPITSEGIPDWDFMETYMCLHEQVVLKELLTNLQQLQTK